MSVDSHSDPKIVLAQLRSTIASLGAIRRANDDDSTSEPTADSATAVLEAPVVPGTPPSSTLGEASVSIELGDNPDEHIDELTDGPKPR